MRELMTKYTNLNYDFLLTISLSIVMLEVLQLSLGEFEFSANVLPSSTKLLGHGLNVGVVKHLIGI